MRVKMFQAVEKGAGVGDTVEVSAERGKFLTERGYAVEVKAKPKAKPKAEAKTEEGSD